MDTWIVRMVRLRSRRRLVAWGVALVCCVVFVLSQRPYINNFINGPYQLGLGELTRIRDAANSPRYFVRVTGSEALDTGLQEITVHKTSGVETSRSVSAAYYALVVGDRLLIFKSSTGSHTTTEGWLANIPANLDRDLFNDAETQALRSRFLPFYVDEESFRLPGYWAIGAGVVFVLLLIWLAVPAWRYFKDPSGHPAVKRAAGWPDPFGAAVAAERESRSPRFKKSNGWTVGDTYLVQSTFFTFDVLRLQDLLWAYKKVTKHSVNFIPTGKTYDAILTCYGGTATIKAPEKTTEEILAFAHERAPWAVVGFSAELEALFKKDQGGFCGAVEQRRLARQA